jgi:hypothetical protein
MAGRLGMTGDSVTRGDKDVMKAQTSKPFLQSLENFSHRMDMPSQPATKKRVFRAKMQMLDRKWEHKAGSKQIGHTLRQPQYLPKVMKSVIGKVETTMSDDDAKKLTAIHGTQGRLPKELDRETRMKAYEARYIAAGGKKGEKWHRRADASEVSRNIGLAGATAGAAGLLASKSPRVAARMAKVKGLRHITPSRAENAALAAGTAGGVSELSGEYARKKRASYQNSPGGVAASALHRMQSYTP